MLARNSFERYTPTTPKWFSLQARFSIREWPLLKFRFGEESRVNSAVCLHLVKAWPRSALQRLCVPARAPA